MNPIRAAWKQPLFPLSAIICIIYLAQMPQVAEPYRILSFINILMFVNLTLSWSIFSGPTHYISLATAGFYGIGVYVSAIVGKDYPLYAVAAFAGLVCFALAFVIGLLTLRLKGVYFILFTFGVSALIRHSLVWWEAHVSHTVGRYIFGGPKDVTLYYYLLGIAALTLLTAYTIRHSKFGLALRSIGESEEAAAHIGINIMLVKTLCFAISAILMGATGAVMAYRGTYIDPSIAFDPRISFLPVVMAIFGGTSRLFGPILGAVVFTLLRNYLITEYPYYYMLITGTILIAAIMFLPEGLSGLVDKAIQRLNQIRLFRRILIRLQGDENA